MALRAVPLSFSSAYLADPHFNPEPVEARSAALWKNLKKSLFGSDQGISFAMLRIEKQCQYPSEDSAVKVEELFVRLIKAFWPELKKWKLGSVQGIFSASDFIELQSIRNQYADLDLYTIWIRPEEGLRDKLRAVRAFDNRPAPEKLLEVKVWMKINANSVYLNQITELDLSHMGLRTLPLEIFKLKALKTLRLAGNPFTTFPYDLGVFPELEWYSLGENEVEVFPRDQIRRDPSRFVTAWENLKKSMVGSDCGISTEMSRIEEQCQYRSEGSSVKAQELFARLAKAFSPEFKKWGLGSVQETDCEKDFIELQALRNQHADEDLISIWTTPKTGLRDKLDAVGAFYYNPPPQRLLEVKFWLTRSTNADYLDQITELDLSWMALRTLPREIFGLKALKILKLEEGNFFTTFPYDLSAFPNLGKYTPGENALDRMQNKASFDAEVVCNLKSKQVLGVRVTVPMNSPCAWKQIYEFQWTGTSWEGEIPRAAEFTFVCIDHLVKRIFDEKKVGKSVVRINWEGQGVTFPAGEVQF